MESTRRVLHTLHETVIFHAFVGIDHLKLGELSDRLLGHWAIRTHIMVRVGLKGSSQRIGNFMAATIAQSFIVGRFTRRHCKGGRIAVVHVVEVTLKCFETLSILEVIDIQSIDIRYIKMTNIRDQ